MLKIVFLNKKNMKDFYLFQVNFTDKIILRDDKNIVR